MVNILVVNLIAPFPVNYTGNTVRVLPISRALTKKYTCFLAAFEEESERVAGLRAEHVYEDILLLPALGTDASFLRYFFPRSGHLARVQHPAYYREIVSKIESFIEKNKIELILVHSLMASEFVEVGYNIPVILDNIDCQTLSVKRRRAYLEGSGLGFVARVALLVTYIRARYQESGLTRRFSLVTTVSPVDRQQLVELNRGGANRIVDIPNGVTPELLDCPIPEKQKRRSIAFWGALDFPPNYSAVAYFYEQVFKPYLSDKGITWYILGRNPGPEISAMGERHENIVVTGFVEDLFGLVSQIPIMINPMQMGGGLKNKVLEAFALERLVISNSMGMEAMPAQDGIHFILANKPREMADCILKYLSAADECARIGVRAREFVTQNYSWAVVGERFLDLVDSVISAGER